MASRKLTISLKRQHAMQVTRVSVRGKKLVYVILTNKPMKYQWRSSRIVYVGTTKTGVSRIAQSVAAKAKDVLGEYGVREFTVRIITCSSRKGLNTWGKLERALILMFREKYGGIPKFNKQGAKSRWSDELEYFRRDRLDTILEDLEQ